ncbi:hypothetical protein NF865_03620 [Thermococcus aggregans]|uniref:Uncharacterized protein n=1 Tax=Thermococcus aggregans TaxID=110163 RepID=A0A9E7SQ13_THEAG|nr:hypothetical protein [Thermococcus aggregans]USS41292.1 hypothetical protein NF865_03620 [Thermococcus aggregans]
MLKVISMSSFKEGLTYPPIRTGLLLLFLALLMSLGASYNVPREELQTGVWGPGTYVIGDEIEASGDIMSISLEISSDNASVKIITNGIENTYTLLGDTKTLEFTSKPSVLVEKGDVRYSYTIKWVDYPYTYLSFPAFFIMIVGSIIAFKGYLSFLESLKEKAVAKKRREKNENHRLR